MLWLESLRWPSLHTEKAKGLQLGVAGMWLPLEEGLAVYSDDILEALPLGSFEGTV